MFGTLVIVLPSFQRVSEATGNEGASFERSYHRAAIVIWGQDNYPRVLMQAGVEAMIPYLRMRVEECSNLPKTKQVEARQKILSLVELVTEAWETRAGTYGEYSLGEEEQTNRAKLLRLLLKLKEPPLLRRFAENVVAKHYEGGEKTPLVGGLRLLEPKMATDVLSSLFEQNMKRSREACIDLLAALVEKGEARPEWLGALRTAATAVVHRLSENASQENADDGTDEDGFGAAWRSPPERKPVPASTVETLFRTLQRLGEPRLAEEAAEVMKANPKTWVPDSVLVPGLSALHCQDRKAFGASPAFAILWKHAAGFLLGRSGVPLAAPTDWAQPVKIDCRCGDCVALNRFAGDPEQRIHRFRVAKNRRQHLHQMIERGRLDMTHETERIGSPQTLVCTKTRSSHEKRCQQYRNDIRHLKTLAKLGGDLPSSFEELREEVGNAIDRAAEVVK